MIEVLDKRVINLSSPSNPLRRVINLSTPSHPLEPVGTRWDLLEPVGTRWDPLEPVWSCVLTFLWGRLHRQKKD